MRKASLASKWGIARWLGAWFSNSSRTQDQTTGSTSDSSSAGDAPAAALKEVAQSQTPPVDSEETMEGLIAQFRMAMAALNTLGVEKTKTDGVEDDTIKVPLHFVLGLLPEHYIVAEELDMVPLRDLIEVGIRDLYKQLATGQILTTVSSLVRSLPPNLITSEAHLDTDTAIVVPLAQTVAGLEPGALKQRTPPESERFDISGLPDLFNKANFDGGVPQPATESPAPPKAEQTDQGVEKVVYDVTIKSSTPGVDLNAATVEQILTIKDVPVETANRIVEYRRAHGSFENIFDLAHVTGMNRATFRAITGMPLNRHRRDRRMILTRLLNIPEESVRHLPSVARVIGQHGDLRGCMISNSDGLLLAQYGIAADSDALSAIVPRMFTQIQDNMHKISGSDVRSASICVDGRMFSIVTGGRIYITVIQHSNKLTRELHKHIAKVARELEWLLSHRGYVEHKRKRDLDRSAEPPNEDEVCTTATPSETV